MSSRHLSLAELHEGLPTIRQSPADAGELVLIVQRPAVGERQTVAVGSLSHKVGLVGDNWSARPEVDPEAQLTIMNARTVALLAQDVERWPLAGDQLYADLDLSLDNLPAGSQLRIGEAVVEVTAEPHRGCRKFIERFGRDAMLFVNSDIGCQLNLRGVNAKVIVDGTIKVKDRITVLRRGTSESQEA